MAAEAGAHFVEIVFMDDRDTLLRRFAARTAAAAETGHVETGELVAALGGEATLTAMYDRLLLRGQQPPARAGAALPRRLAGARSTPSCWM